jgi:Arc/MetJ-type ribon-helix-helix transcriptional regulator
MTIHLPEDLVHSIRAEVLSGHFVSAEELVAAAVRDYLCRQHGQVRPDGATPRAGCATPAEQQTSAQALQHRLLEAGVLSEIKPPISDLTPYEHRQAVAIQGEPLSETVLRKRR